MSSFRISDKNLTSNQKLLLTIHYTFSGKEKNLSREKREEEVGGDDKRVRTDRSRNGWEAKGRTLLLFCYIV